MIDYDYDNIDWEYEDFRDETGHITNIADFLDVEVYKKAIDIFVAENPDYALHIGEGYEGKTKHALYCTAGGELGRFWKIARDIEEGKTP